MAASPPPTAKGSWLATQGRLPLAFMALGLAWFLAAAAATATQSGLLAVPHIAPGVIALTHMWVLGFFVTIAVGAIYQLAPVALGTTLWSEHTGWWHLALHGVGVPAMILGFSEWNLALLAGAGGGVTVGVLVFAVNALATIVRSGKRDAVAWSLALATVWLVLTVLAGLVLVTNRLWHFWPTDPLPLLRAHAHLGLIGFFTTLLQGVTFRLVPMFTLGDVPDWRPVRFGLWCSQLGLIVLTPALAYNRGRLAALAGGVIVVGFAASAWAFKLTLGTRKKRQLDVGLVGLVRGCCVLGVTAAAALWLVWPTTRAGSAPGGLSANVYGVLVFAGGLLPAIAGMMNKIVPFLTWMRAYGPKVGRAPTPPATALSHARLEHVALTIVTFSVVPLLIGTWTLSPIWLQLGSALLLLGALAFTANMALVFKHLWRPVVLPAPAPRPVL